MNLNEYQILARKTAIYPREQAIEYCALALSGEAGECAGKVSKRIRDGVLDRADMVKELGDVLWCLSQLALELGIGLEEVATTNLKKLADRQTRGVLGGSGDAR